MSLSAETAEKLQLSLRKFQAADKALGQSVQPKDRATKAEAYLDARREHQAAIGEAESEHYGPGN